LDQWLQRLGNQHLGVAQAQTSLAQANNSVRDSFKQNGTAISGATAKAIANQQAIQNSVAASQALASAIGKQTGSTKAEIGSLQSSKASLEAVLASQRKLTPAVQAYIDKLFQIPKKLQPTQVDVDKANAEAKLAQFKSHIVSLNGYRASTAVNANTNQALARIKDVRDHLNDLNGKTATTYVATVVYQTNAANKRVAGSARAGGGEVFGPGTATSDSVLIRASKGEFVVNAAAYAKHKELVQAVNDGRFAAGGEISTTTRSGKKYWVYNGILYSSEAAADNARTRAEQAAARRQAAAAAQPHDVTRTSHGGAVQGIVAGVRGEIPHATQAMRDLSKAMDDAFRLRSINTQLDQARTKLTQLKQAQGQLTSDTASALRQGFNPAQAGGSLAYILGSFSTQTASANKFRTEEHTLAAKGLDKSYLAELARNGQGATLDALAHASAADISKVSAAYRAYEGSVAAAGRVAGSDVYGSAVAAQTKQVDKLTSALRAQYSRIDHLLQQVSRLANRPVQVTLDGKVIANVVAKRLAGSAR
jgi:hypothetical protein